MKIKKEGVVIFKSGEIIEINDFEIEDGGLEDLEVWVFEHYKRIHEER